MMRRGQAVAPPTGPTSLSYKGVSIVPHRPPQTLFLLLTPHTRGLNPNLGRDHMFSGLDVLSLFSSTGKLASFSNHANQQDASREVRRVTPPLSWLHPLSQRPLVELHAHTSAVPITANDEQS